MRGAGKDRVIRYRPSSASARWTHLLNAIDLQLWDSPPSPDVVRHIKSHPITKEMLKRGWGRVRCNSLAQALSIPVGISANNRRGPCLLRRLGALLLRVAFLLLLPGVLGFGGTGESGRSGVFRLTCGVAGNRHSGGSLPLAAAPRRGGARATSNQET